MSHNIPPQQQPYNSGQNTHDIDLFEWFESIWQEKTLIVLVTAVFTALALIYALVAAPIYQVQSIVQPAAIKDLDELSGSGIYKLSPADALSQVGASLESYETRLGYFKANQELFAPMLLESQTPEQAFARLSRENIKVLKTDAKGTGFAEYVGIQFQYPKGVDGAAIANGLVNYAVTLEKQRIASNLEVVIKNKLNRLHRDINAERAGYAASKEAEIALLTEEDILKKAQLTDELAAVREELKVNRENRIKQLDEAIEIAQALGIKKPVASALLAQEGQRSSSTKKGEERSEQQVILYLLGTDALNAERTTLQSRSNDDFTSRRLVELNTKLKLLEHNRQIEILKTRENDDLFLEDLADNRKEIARLKSLDLNLDELRLVRVDQIAIEPTSALKPNKKLIVAVGVVMGGMLGVFAALIRSVMRKRKVRQSSAQ